MLEVLKNLTWLSLKNPLSLSVLLAVFMQLIGKPLLTLLYLTIAQAIARKLGKLQGPPAAPVKPNGLDLLINLITLGLAWVIMALQIGTDLSPGDAFVTALVAAALSIMEYEGTKNAIAAMGLKWW